MKLKRALTSLAITKLEEAWQEFCFDAGVLYDDLSDNTNENYRYLFHHFKFGVNSGLRSLGKHEGEVSEEYED